MALKYRVEKLEDVEEAVRGLYKQDAAGGFVLDAEGIDDPAELKRAKDHEKEARQKAEAELKKMKEAQKASEEVARKAAEEAAAKSGDLEALRKSADERVAAAVAEAEGKYKPQLDKYQASLRRSKIDNVAQELATRIGIKGSEQILIPHLISRLDVDERDGDFVTVVRDSKGQASALTIADLEKEFVSNPVFAPVIVGSKGSGGGANGNANKGGGAPGAKQMKRAEFDALNPVDRAATMKAGTTLVD